MISPPPGPRSVVCGCGLPPMIPFTSTAGSTHVRSRILAALGSARAHPARASARSPDGAAPVLDLLVVGLTIPARNGSGSARSAAGPRRAAHEHVARVQRRAAEHARVEVALARLHVTWKTRSRASPEERGTCPARACPVEDDACVAAALVRSRKSTIECRPTPPRRRRRSARSPAARPRRRAARRP